MALFCVFFFLEYNNTLYGLVTPELVYFYVMCLFLIKDINSEVYYNRGKIFL